METINYQLITEVGDLIVSPELLRKFIYLFLVGLTQDVTETLIIS